MFVIILNQETKSEKDGLIEEAGLKLDDWIKCY
jgi:hypothetical protein